MTGNLDFLKTSSLKSTIDFKKAFNEVAGSIQYNFAKCFLLVNNIALAQYGQNNQYQFKLESTQNIQNSS